MPAAAPPAPPAPAAPVPAVGRVEGALACLLGLVAAASGRWPELLSGGTPDGVVGRVWVAGQLERGSLPPQEPALCLALVGLDGLGLVAAYLGARAAGVDRGSAAAGAGLMGLLALILARINPDLAAPGLLPIAVLAALALSPRRSLQLRVVAVAALLLGGIFSLGGGLLVGLSLGLIAALATRLGPGRALLASGVGALVLSLGPLLEIGGESVVIGGRQLPLPASILSATPFFPSDFPWSALGAAALAGLALELRPLKRARMPCALALCGVAALVLGLQGARSARQIAPLPRGAARTLAALDGRAVHLPIDSPERAPGERAAARRLLQALQAHDALPPPPGQQPSPYFADPLVPLLLDLEAGQERWALPPGHPGDALTAAGARWLVIHRADLPPDALHRLDPVLRARFGPPQRDLAAALDLYRLQASATDFNPALLVPADAPLPDGYRSLSTALEDWRAGR